MGPDGGDGPIGPDLDAIFFDGVFGGILTITVSVVAIVILLTFEIYADNAQYNIDKIQERIEKVKGVVDHKVTTDLQVRGLEVLDGIEGTEHLNKLWAIVVILSCFIIVMLLWARYDLGGIIKVLRKLGKSGAIGGRLQRRFEEAVQVVMEEEKRADAKRQRKVTG